ncbi:hypothetical protein STEG23_026249, partial [Scotinomys teguina]
DSIPRRMSGGHWGHQMEDTSTCAVAEEAASDPENAAVAKSILASLPRDDETMCEAVTFSSSPVLDLSQRGLCHLGEFFKIPNLQLHLEPRNITVVCCKTTQHTQRPCQGHHNTENTLIPITVLQEPGGHLYQKDGISRIGGSETLAGGSRLWLLEEESSTVVVADTLTCTTHTVLPCQGGPITPTLQQLHLQRNSLSGIPKDFFQWLPNLTWLDLRYNKIRALPPGIGSHKHLKTLLLERNPIKMLPIELGQVTTLKALNLRHCPLEFPPHLIVQKGLVAILSFLRICSVETTIPGNESLRELSEVKMRLNDLPCPVLAQPCKSTSNEKDLNVPSHEAAVVKEKADFFPPVDRLDLSELRKSSASSENWPSEEEIRRFWKLRQEIVENEKVGIPEKKLLAVELPPNLRAALNAKEKRCRKPGSKGRKKSTSFKGIFPSLPSTYQNTVHTKRLEDSHLVALQELKGKESLLEQRRRDKRALQEWREQTQLMRSRRAVNKFQSPRRNMMASKIPFATDLTEHGNTAVNPFGTVKYHKKRTAQSSGETSASPLADLEEKIRHHTQQIRTHNFLGTNPLQDMKVAKQDLET